MLKTLQAEINILNVRGSASTSTARSNEAAASFPPSPSLISSHPVLARDLVRSRSFY